MSGAGLRPPVFAFVRLTRPQFLLGGLAGCGLGAAIAFHERGALNWGAYALAQGAVLAFQLMTHYGNDYFDRAGDARSARTAFSGGSGALVDGSLAPVVGLRAALACGALGALAALWLALTGHALGGLIAAAIGVLAWAYSAPPFRLLASGWGEATATLVVGTLVPLCAYASQTGTLDRLALAGTLPGAGAMLATMFAVEFPDVDADRASGKRNLVVRLGKSRALRAAWAALVSAYLGVAVALLAGAPPTLLFFEAATLPLALVLGRDFARRSDGVLALRGAALFLLVTLFGLLAYLR